MLPDKVVQPAWFGAPVDKHDQHNVPRCVQVALPHKVQHQGCQLLMIVSPAQRLEGVCALSTYAAGG